MAAPDQVGLEADDRVAAPDLAAGDALEHEAARPGGAQAQRHGDRRVEVGRQALVDDLAPTGRVLRLERGEVRGERHLS